MGTEIGFNLYDKQTYDTTGEFKRINIELPYLCGRNELTSTWGNYFRDDNKVTVPVFQKELDGKTNAEDYYEESYTYTNFEDFANEITKTAEQLTHESTEYRNELRERVHTLDNRIKELRRCQMECASNNSFAFERWADEIQQMYSEIDDIKDTLRTFDRDDDNLVAVRNMQEIITTMRRYLSDNRYYVIPYFSY